MGVAKPVLRRLASSLRKKLCASSAVPKRRSSMRGLFTLPVCMLTAVSEMLMLW